MYTDMLVIGCLQTKFSLTPEQKARIERNRQAAEAKLAKQLNSPTSKNCTNNIQPIDLVLYCGY
jgi:hypothetical protein